MVLLQRPCWGFLPAPMRGGCCWTDLLGSDSSDADRGGPFRPRPRPVRPPSILQPSSWDVQSRRQPSVDLSLSRAI